MSNNSTSANTTTFQRLVEENPCGNQEPDSAAINGVKISLYVVIVVASLMGNTLIICILRSHQKLKTATNYFILNLAAADILITMFGAGYMLKTFFIGHSVPSNIFGTILCKTIHPMAGIALYGAILTLVAIAVDRFLAVTFPLKKLVTVSVARYAISFVWFASFLACSPLFYAIKLHKYQEMGLCYEDWTPVFPENSAKIFTISHNVIFYVIPLSLMTVLYAFIIRKVWLRHIPGQATEANQRVENKIKRSVLKMLITVVVLFASCWLPINIAMVVTDFGSSNCFPGALMFAGWFLGHSNAAINPLIYLFFSREYRHGALNLLEKLVRCCPKLSLIHRGRMAEITSDGMSMSQVVTDVTSVSDGAVIKSFKRKEHR